MHKIVILLTCILYKKYYFMNYSSGLLFYIAKSVRIFFLLISLKFYLTIISIFIYLLNIIVLV